MLTAPAVEYLIFIEATKQQTWTMQIQSIDIYLSFSYHFDSYLDCGTLKLQKQMQMIHNVETAA